VVTRSAAINSAFVQQIVVDRLRADAFDAILHARWSFVVGLRRSDIVQVVTIGAGRSGLAVNQLVNGSVALVLAIASAAVAVAVAPVVGLASIVAVALVGVAQGSGIRPAYRLGHELGERSRVLQAVVTDSLDSLRLVRAHDASAVWIDRLAAAFGGARDVQIANTRRMSSVAAVTSVGMALAASTLVLGATWLDVSPTSIVVMVVLVNRLSGQVRTVVTAATQLANSLPAVGDITELTAEAQSAREVPTTTIDEQERSEDPILLEFRDVSFRYPTGERGELPGDAHAGVRSLSFTVPRGEITVITGPSGAGKSTTADLALGLLVADSGEVVADGRPLTIERLGAWRSTVAYVPQETVVLPGTLRDNLTWSVGRDVGDDECSVALRRAAASFVEHLPDGLDTELGERGIRLSGGERQRVAIARALLRDPLLLVLDEATSSLDDATEAEVLATIRSLTPTVTVLVIAHRRTTIDLADQVVRIEAGRRIDRA
jgi:ABC-type multidrug transport system fused ATPase/permease subunit